MAGVSASVAEEPVPGAELVDADGSDYFVGSSGSDEWTIRGTSAKPKVVEWLADPVPADTDARRRQGTAVLWARKCSKARQKVHFRRSFFIPGPEYSLGATVQPVVRGRGSFESIVMRVNGIRVLKTRGSTVGFDPTEKDVKQLRFGQNNLEVIAVKRKSDRGVKCNASKATRFGVAFFVHGEFGGDTGLLDPPAGDSKQDVTGRSTVNQTLNYEVRNNGPGGAAVMRFQLRLAIPRTSDSPDQPVVLPKPGADVESCEIAYLTPGDYYNPIVNCRMRNVQAGTRIQIPVQVAFTLPEQRPFYYTTLYMDWSVNHGGEEDPNTAENARQAKIHYCEDAATGPPCK